MERIPRNIGVLKKIESQILEWRNQGHNVKEINIFDFYPKLIELLSLIPGPLRSYLKVFISSYGLKRHLVNEEYDIIYSRALLYNPFLNFLKQKRYVMELNSNDLDEYIKTSRLRYIYSIITRRLLFNIPKAFICISNEVRDYYAEFNKKTIVIANACPAYSTPDRTHRNNKRPKIGFIGSNQYVWNGADKVLDLAKHFQEYDFEIIGFHLQNKPDNVKTFGFLSEEESIKVMTSWNAAFSTLSLYEQGLNEASPLKSRLYLAMNIPFVYAYDDTDEPFTGCLKISNTPDNTKTYLNEISNFFKKVVSAPDININHNCSIHFKERSRIEFMKSTFGLEV